MTLSDQIVGALVKDILSPITEPGARLDQPSICRKFGVSRTPIREALRILSRNGLVEVTGRKGVTVAPTGVDRLHDMFEALSEFEAHCAKLGVVHMTLLEKKRLEVVNLNRELRILDGTGDLAPLNTNSTKSSVTARTTQASQWSREAFGKGLLLFEHFNSCPAKPNIGAYTVMRDHGTMAPSYVADRFRTHPGCLLKLQALKGRRQASDRHETGLAQNAGLQQSRGETITWVVAVTRPLTGRLPGSPRRAVAWTSVLATVPNQRRKWVFVDAIQAKPASPAGDFPCRLPPAVAIGSFDA